jgi:hypothetical protein
MRSPRPWNDRQEGDVTALWNEAAHRQTDREVIANRQNIIIKNKKGRHAH